MFFNKTNIVALEKACADYQQAIDNYVKSSANYRETIVKLNEHINLQDSIIAALKQERFSNGRRD